MGEPLKTCPEGWTGVGCDLQCTDPDICDFELYCHSDGRTYGVSTVGTQLFSLSLDQTPLKILATLEAFLSQRPEMVGCAPGLSSADIGLSPSANFRTTAGALTIFRFDQFYRGIPIFGGDQQVTVVATPPGAIALRGAITDARPEYAHYEDSCTPKSEGLRS